MTARRLPPLSFSFALLGALLAHLTMTVLQTAMLDAGAHWIGLGLSALAGALTGLCVPRLRRRGGGVRAPAIAVIVAGMGVGMLMQLTLWVREPPERAYVLSSTLSTRDPLAWILVGAPVGAIPALLLVATYLLVTHLQRAHASRSEHVPAEDAWERILAPCAGAAALLGGASAAWTDTPVRFAGFAIVLLSALAALEIVLRDRARARWLQRVLAGRDAQHEVIPLTSPADDVPLAVGATTAEALIVRVIDGARYRSAARAPVARVPYSWQRVVAPMQRRRTHLLVAQVGAVALLLGSAVTSQAQHPPQMDVL